MAFTEIKTSQLNCESGAIPVNNFNAQSGEETRLLSGSMRD